MIYLGMTAIGMQDFVAARSILSESNQIAETNMDRWAHAFGLDLLGIAAMSEGQNEEALINFKQSVALYKEIGDQMNSAQAVIHMGQACAAMHLEDEAKRLYLEVYADVQANKWSPLLLNALISFTEISHDLPPETKLAVALSVLGHPAITPYLRGRSEKIHNEANAMLNKEMIRVAEELAREKSPELWAQEILK
jgi:tetratricopeptide (TPR) repeat protein